MIQNTRLLWAVVLALGAVLAIGTGALVVTMGQRMADFAHAADPAAAAWNRIALPAGARVLEMDLDGDRLALRLLLPDGVESVAVFDIVQGERLGTVAVPAAAP